MDHAPSQSRAKTIRHVKEARVTSEVGAAVCHDTTYGQAGACVLRWIASQKNSKARLYGLERSFRTGWTAPLCVARLGQ